MLTQAPPSSGGSSAGGAETQSKLRRGAIVLFKGLALWGPALLFWGSLVWGGNIFDDRTQEEIDEDEAEVRRLERFFDVEGLPEDEYLTEWTAKDEALCKMVDKLLRAQRFVDCLVSGDSSSVGQSKEDEAAAIEVSYVLPPEALIGNVDEASSSEAAGPRPWHPRLIVAHRLGSLALVSSSFEHVAGKKDREERWACTSLRVELVALPNGEPLCESFCDLQGPWPHGVTYMRI